MDYPFAFLATSLVFPKGYDSVRGGLLFASCQGQRGADNRFWSFTAFPEFVLKSSSRGLVGMQNLPKSELNQRPLKHKVSLSHQHGLGAGGGGVMERRTFDLNLYWQSVVTLTCQSHFVLPPYKRKVEITIAATAVFSLSDAFSFLKCQCSG